MQIQCQRDLQASILISINVLIDMIGIVLFSSMIIVTIKYNLKIFFILLSILQILPRNLHTTCCLLIGLFAFCSLFNKSLSFMPAIVCTIIGLPLPLYICSIVQIIPVFMTFSYHIILAAIALDRTISALMPLRYKKIHKKLYLAAICLISSIYPFYCCSIFAQFVWAHKYDPSYCGFLDMVGGNDFLIVYNLYITNLIIIFLYIIISLKLLFLHKDESGSTTSNANQPLFKSLSIVFAIQIFGWFISSVAFNLLVTIASDSQRPFLSSLFNYFISMTTSAEMVSIYYTSINHRNAYRKEFKWFFRLFTKNSNQIMVSNAVMVNNFAGSIHHNTTI